MYASHHFQEKVTTAVIRDFEAVKNQGFDIRQPVKLLVAFSGGPDSSALLIALSTLAKKCNWSVEAAHVNHHLRGADADGDQEFCQDLCLRLAVPLHIKQDLAAGDGASLSEDALRQRRYQFLMAVGEQIEASALFTGHTLDDQVETIFFRLIRGTSLAGVKGIPSHRRLESGLFVMRPLLSLTRAEVSQFLSEHSIEARQDRSNEELKYNRNFLRHKLIQPLKERFPGFLERVQRFACAAAIDDDFVQSIACQWYQRLELDQDCWSEPDFSHLHAAVLNRIFALGLSKRGIEVTNERIDLLVRQIKSTAPGDERISLNEHWDVKKTGNHLWWLDKNIESLPARLFEVPLRVPGITVILPLARAVRVEVLAENPDQDFPAEESLEAIVDLSSLTGAMVLRRRQAGDFIQPFGRQEQVSLKKFLHTRKAAAHRLDLQHSLDPEWTVNQCIVLAAGDEVLWIPGVGLSEKLRVRHKPTHRLAILSLADDVTIA